jgi:hypothetical protein
VKFLVQTALSRGSVPQRFSEAVICTELGSVALLGRPQLAIFVLQNEQPPFKISCSLGDLEQGLQLPTFEL